MPNGRGNGRVTTIKGIQFENVFPATITVLPSCFYSTSNELLPCNCDDQQANPVLDCSEADLELKRVSI